MKIGYAVEDSVHEGFLEGLKRKWCKEAELIPGAMRGSTRQAIRREIRKTCLELRQKGAALIVFLTDADNETWEEVLKRERSYIPQNFNDIVIYAVASRNVECWIALDAHHAAQKLNINVNELGIEDPHGVIRNALHKIPRETQDIIADIVETMPMHRHLRQNNATAKSLKALYEDARDCAQKLDCENFPNELDST